MTTPAETKVPVSYIPFGSDVTSPIMNAPSVDLEANVDNLISYLTINPLRYFDISNTSSGLSLVILDGLYMRNGIVQYVPGTTISLVNNASNKIKINPSTNTITSSTAATTLLEFPLYEIITSGGSVITTNNHRSFLSITQPGHGYGFDADTVDTLHAGNAAGNVAVNNGVENTNLNAQLLNGLTSGNSSGQIPRSNGVQNVNLVAANSAQLNGLTSGNGNGQIPINNGSLNTNLVAANSVQLNGLTGNVGAVANTIPVRDGSGFIYTASPSNFVVFDTISVNRNFYFNNLPLAPGAPWSAVSRSVGVWYQNNSQTQYRGVAVIMHISNVRSGELLFSNNGGATSTKISEFLEFGSGNGYCTLFGIIPPLKHYRVNEILAGSVISWLEI